MARHWQHGTKVGSGDNAIPVGYSAKPRNGFLNVVFNGPTGERVQKATTCKKSDQNFHVEAARLIAKAYATAYPDVKRVTWQEATDAITASREATVIAYRKAVAQLLETLDAEKIKPNNPSEITPELANRFARLWLQGTYTRSNASDAKRYARKPTTLNFYLRQLSAVWAKQFIPVGFAKSNPWEAVAMAETDKAAKPEPTANAMQTLFEYVQTRYPEWKALHALIELKALSACRLRDVCLLESDQVKDGRVTWRAEQTKQREGRTVKLPAELFDTLREVAGETYLWQGIIDGLGKHRRKQTHKNDKTQAERVYNIVGNVFREFSDANPEHAMSSHALRRWGITEAVKVTQSIDAAAFAIGITPACAKAHYLNSQRAFNADDVFSKMSLPKCPATVPLKRNTEEQPGTSKNTEAA